MPRLKIIKEKDLTREYHNILKVDYIDLTKYLCYNDYIDFIESDLCAISINDVLFKIIRSRFDASKGNVLGRDEFMTLILKFF